ncbi:tetratricopeptide repeat-containing sulfotransferase family protein [Gilvimarinus sp. 1_MG-2023]|uniref:tetratricopeptide repeat-containing sulfotransferase family protein n=1 Tax=Gilvimarinus sp. 1_MG-2023 TaxID=3062638 RepID=UPI0026E287CB|nr:tetratricopeptide repeat-containing sulfotransferase family protein [Gilvimarinus sp. 1_MG-2023]MDO6746738.1 sulfotransferase [Gilvimarinus sp. 1_MG-2023]
MDEVELKQTLQRAQALYQSGDWRLAGQLALQVCQQVPDQSEALHLLGMCSYQVAQYTQAAQCFARLAALNPNNHNALFLAGMALAAAGDLVAAEQYLSRATAQNPEHVDGHVHLAKVLSGQGKHQAAIDVLQPLFQRLPTLFEVQSLLADLWLELGDINRAETHYLQVLTTSPEHESALAGQARVLLRRNNPQAAQDLLAHWQDKFEGLSAASVLVLTEVWEKNAQAERAIECLERLCQSDRLQGADRALGLFTLGKILDKQADYDRAFAVYRQANRAAAIGYRADATQTFFAALQAALDGADCFPAKREHDTLSVVPVFVVGMPRSGTSLTEQILASHPQVEGAGETQGVAHLIQFMQAQGYGYPEGVAQLTAPDIAQMRAIYQTHLPNSTGQKVSVMIDKMPDNFKHLLLISRVFPEAKIIHVTRNPVDTCLSCYFQYFSGAHDYAYDLASLADYYQRYQAWMQALKTANVVALHTLQYETLVQDFKPVVAAALNFCNLAWDERCEDFYRTGRAVATASYDQASRPLYQGSIERWRHYDSHLAELKPLLA